VHPPDEMLAELEELDLLKQQIFELESQLLEAQEQQVELRKEKRKSEQMLRKYLEEKATEETTKVRKPAFKTIWMSGFLTRGGLY